MKGGENMDVAIAITIVLAAAFLGIFLTYPLIKSTIKMHNARQGERTKFEIDTTDKGYNYYKDKVDTWLNDVGFSKYKSKKEARYLKYHKNTVKDMLYMNSDYSEYLIKVISEEYTSKKAEWIKKLTIIHKLSYKLDVSNAKENSMLIHIIKGEF